MIHGIGFNTYPSFMARVIDIARRKGFIVESLGTVGTGDNINLLVPEVVDVTKPNIMLMAGFHGDEAGGVYGIAHMLESVPAELLHCVNLSIAPAVNPAGLRLCQRRDYTDSDPNRGYCHHERMEALGEVGNILMQHADRLSQCARHGFLTLHEDGSLTDTFYLISNDRTETSNETLARLMSAGQQFFNRQPDGLHHEHFITEGCGSWFCDSSFEDMLSHDGVKRLYVLETPSNATVESRARTAASIARAFIVQSVSVVNVVGTEII